MRKRIMVLILSGAFGCAGLGLLVAYPDLDSAWGIGLFVVAVLLLELFALSAFLGWKFWSYRWPLTPVDPPHTDRNKHE